MAQQPALAVHKPLLLIWGEMGVGLTPVVRNKTSRVLAAETPGNYLIDSMISTLEQQPAALRLKAEAH